MMRLERLRKEARRLRSAYRFYRHETSLREFTARGHYHSPLPDIKAAAAHADAALNSTPLGIDLNLEKQSAFLNQMVPLEPQFDWPEAPQSRRFHTSQEWFGPPDAFVLFAMLTILQPRRIIEIGSGFSSALMLDTAERLQDAPQFTFIEPNPDRLKSLLRPNDLSRVNLISERVQNVSTSLFRGLQAGDILFIDSSHVSTTGSDVNHLFFEIFPTLAPGVVVHLHDIFWPFEYPASWIRMGLAWNEAHLLRAFLTFNPRFGVLFWAPSIARHTKNPLSSIDLTQGASFWMTIEELERGY